MTTDDDTDLQLLLSDAEHHSPVLASGLPESSLLGAQPPERVPRGQDSMHLEALDRDPNDLPAQRWAVIAAEGPGGDAAIEAIRELIAHRRDLQGAAPTIYRVPAEMDAVASLRWKNEVLRDEEVAVDERPRYLMILGDLDSVSLELQHAIANGSFVGRLHCPTLKGYRNYAEKVVACERSAPVRRARSLFYTTQDGSGAIGTGYRHLLEPCMRMTDDLASRGKLELDALTEIPYSDWGPDELLAVSSVDTPSLMFSLSHGAGAPRRGWRSTDHQRALQGALSMGGEGPLTADMVRESPFLPGGVLMCIACFGAGTPPTSAFYPWLSQLASQGGAPEQAAAVLRALPKPGERPFVAALPQALLANPSGPLAVIGHMDLAWTFGFTDPSGKKSRASRMFATLRAVLGGSRVGVGLDALMHAYREANDDLMARYQLQRDAAARGHADPVAPRMIGDLWMQRNDLRGYMLLGDPAARMPLASALPVVRATPAIAVVSAAPAPAVPAPTPAAPTSSASDVPAPEPTISPPVPAPLALSPSPPPSSHSIAEAPMTTPQSPPPYAPPHAGEPCPSAALRPGAGVYREAGRRALGG